ncbi:hypothetical protein ACH5RR_009003 [Cinchona calisaya]|uniref:NAC domain-containing protein n=1 Tax=Cinchona calisaya TaxID=153742 RepID=A0ABD3ACY2_9GENT
MKKFRIPPGFQFNPSDQQLLNYLKVKANGKSFPPWKNVVVEKNLYSQDNVVPWFLSTEEGDEYPWQITTKIDAAHGKIHVEKVLCVVTKLEKLGGKRAVRSVGSWTWDGSSGQKNIWNDQGQVMGFKKVLNLRGKKGMEIVGNWIMYEYHLSGDSLKEVENNDDHVICRIKCDYLKSIVEKSGDESGKLGKRRVNFDREIQGGKRVCCRGGNGDEVMVISETEEQESGQCDESLSMENSRFDQEILMGKRVSDSIVVNEGILFLETDRVQDGEDYCGNSYELESLTKENSIFFYQEKLVETEVCSSSINSIGANAINLECCCSGIGKAGGEFDIMQQVQEDNLYFDLSNIIDLDDLTFL